MLYSLVGIVGIVVGGAFGFMLCIVVSKITQIQERHVHSQDRYAQPDRRVQPDRRQRATTRHIPFYDDHGNWIQYDRRTQPDRRLASTVVGKV